MRVGILTLWGDYNYGNRFQNYAVQKLCEEHGAEAETIVPIERPFWNTSRLVYKYACAWTGIPHGKHNLRLRHFNRQFLHYRHIPLQRLPHKISEQYDAFIVGSDQVWNPAYWSHFLFHYSPQAENFFLSFANDRQRICLSPSLGIERIPLSEEKRFQKGLAGFRYLSCREAAGAAEIERLTGRKCEVLSDPVFGLLPEQWRALEDNTEIPQEPYVLAFFLGEGDNISNQMLERLRVSYRVTNAGKRESRYYASSPQAILALIDHARLILTDSFHFTAFSILFNRRFYVFERTDRSDLQNTQMTSRIATLTEKFHLRDRYITGKPPETPDMACDFTAANAVREAERQKLKAYLSKCLQACME